MRSLKTPFLGNPIRFLKSNDGILPRVEVTLALLVVALTVDALGCRAAVIKPTFGRLKA